MLDLMLPGVDGLEITRRLRAEGETPIIMPLTSQRGDRPHRRAGDGRGRLRGETVQPPGTGQPRARSCAAPGTRPRPSGPRCSASARCRSTRARAWLPSDGAEIVLTAKEFDLLWMLAGHPRQVFSRTQLLDRVWGETEYLDPSTVTVHVRRLREKIEPDPSDPAYIQTVWGVGYKFEPAS
ncbi:MAG: response regulator transcription factor [Caldilineaceae bacterium]